MCLQSLSAGLSLAFALFVAATPRYRVAKHACLKRVADGAWPAADTCACLVGGGRFHSRDFAKDEGDVHVSAAVTKQKEADMQQLEAEKQAEEKPGTDEEGDQ